MAKYIKAADLLDEARERFQFLKDADFVGPEEGDYWLSYSSGFIGVEVHYDDRDGRVVTIVRTTVGDRNPRASLQCLYVTAKLGAAQDIREIARSGKSIAAVLESQAVALRKLLPIIEGGRGPDLILGCHGR
jgi:hypothetical protein